MESIQPNSVEKSADQWTRYQITLSTPAIDIEGRRLAAGTVVLVDPAIPTVLALDTPANRRKFQQQDFSWTVEGRAEYLFAREKPEVLDKINAARGYADRFMDAIDRNLRDSIGNEFPRTHRNAIIDAFLLWEPDIRSVTMSDLAGGFNFISVLQRHAGVPAEVPWPDTWIERLKATNKLRVYSVKSLAGRIEVVCCFLTPVRVVPETGPEIVPPGIEHAQLVEKIYDQWRSGQRFSSSSMTFFTFGTMDSWEDGIRHRITSGSKILHFYRLGNSHISEAIEPRLDAETKSFRDFRDQLKPETMNERLARLRQLIRDHEDRGKNAAGGNLDLETIAQRTGYRLSAVESLCFRLQRERGYQVYKLQGGPKKGLAIRTGDRPGVKEHRLHRSWPWRILELLGYSGVVGILSIPLKTLLCRVPRLTDQLNHLLVTPLNCSVSLKSSLKLALLVGLIAIPGAYIWRVGEKVFNQFIGKE